MNFPVEKKLYKHLISLHPTEKPIGQITTTIYQPAVRDCEPKLKNYCCPSFAPEQPVSVNINFPSNSCTRTYNAFSTYKTMRSWKK